MISMSALGILGTGASSLMMLSMGATQMFVNSGLYASAEQGANRRLFISGMPEV